MERRSVYSIQFLKINWVVVSIFVCVWFNLMGCSTQGLGNSESSLKENSMVLAFVQVEPKGPYFRKHQTEPTIRYFDVRNISTGELTRLTMESKTDRLVARLASGEYELFRVQVGEGPFRAEALVNMTFQVDQEKITFLGIWRFLVDPPKTVRMLHWEVVADQDLVRDLSPDLGDESIVVSLPKPVATQVRLFAVAPSQPRAKYFYRR